MTTQTKAPPAIELTDVHKVFRTMTGEPVTAVNGLDLSIGQGEIVAFLGPNGAGKTTTLDMVLGLTEPSTGTATVFGIPPRKAVDAGRVSAVLQTGGLLSDLSVRETVEMIAALYADATPVEQVIARAGLEPIARRKVSKCSGGEQQRLRFALALLPDPDLLILDEPTAGMDVTARRDFWDTMRSDTDSGRTVVFATHYLEEANAFADRIVMIAQGQVVADGSTAQIRAMSSGRTVTAALPAERLEPVAESLRATSGVTEVTTRGERLAVRAADSDQIARLLLGEYGGFDLEITTADLESAFIDLTGPSAMGAAK
ncbi:ATP-binding cassette domain-containing protein [Epidermidibacterium keratini]|uniref:ATP-binding cassette domain-containing protein n=1 Tax=Epidermidibacterium keratini TaxID=1891644 RepID=A0A7L4YJY3_9ACTN|nr:ABC transporter ATP-binding protein [Epidermidibacterium keratini]QHB98856.1 ATP-binding cassette domain-containing protein [Epidermidibacterium keratini]